MDFTASLALFATLIAAALQLAIYYPKLPDRVAIHFNLSLEPNSYVSKVAYVVFWAGFIAFLAIVPFIARPAPPLLFTVAALAILVIVNQFVIMANLNEGKMSGWVFVPIGFMVALALFFASRGTR